MKEKIPLQYRATACQCSEPWGSGGWAWWNFTSPLIYCSDKELLIKHALWRGPSVILHDTSLPILEISLPMSSVHIRPGGSVWLRYQDSIMEVHSQSNYQHTPFFMNWYPGCTLTCDTYIKKVFCSSFIQSYTK